MDNGIIWLYFDNNWKLISYNSCNWWLGRIKYCFKSVIVGNEWLYIALGPSHNAFEIAAEGKWVV